MSNIDKQALRGQSVEGSFYLVECCNCGEMYPSNLLDGGEAIADSGDYGDCYCHLCWADDTERADWGDVNSNEAKAWNFQQKRIEALLDELEAADKRIAELEAVTPEQRAEHDAGMKEFAAMLQGADRPQNETQNIPENIPATQFKPVADLYGLTSPTGSETSFTFDAVEARDFIGGGWSCQEYVELERFQEAVSGNSPVIPDGWVACSERMPGMGVDVLACTISPIGGFEEIETAQWHGGMKGEQPVFITSADAIEPTHWMPLPAAPKQELK
ncbi:DUF551 domain-containing protein [Enterobacter roggenkampii]|uniref:DUF551 domain-containing protein n=2 Tax=Enterobacter roggenkampii TaxID=1812935 RepID=UPI0018AC363E|nr:DUF551 domain-containing protein [Enterobacter roggenkampii]